MPKSGPHTKCFRQLASIKRQKPREGDLFVMDLGAKPVQFYKASPSSFVDEQGCYAYGRLVHLAPTGEAIVEIFDYAGPWIQDLDSLPRVSTKMHALFVTGLGFIHGFWKILESDSLFDKWAWGMERLAFVMPSLPVPKLWRATGEVRPATPGEVALYPSYTVYFPENIQEMILAKADPGSQFASKCP